MELGLTFPLQRFLHSRPPAYGSEEDLRFCWDLHSIELRGCRCLLAVHCRSRYTFVWYDVSPARWANLPDLFREGLTESLTAAGFSPARIEAYLEASGEFAITRTHGRRAVAFLNRAWDDVVALDTCVDSSAQTQPMLEHAVNSRLCRCAGFDGPGVPLERMALSLPPL